MKKALIVWACAAMVVLASVPAARAWGEKEMENETRAVNFLRETERGGYQVVTTADLKGWVDQGRDMLVVDTMPFEDSFKKSHIPGAAQFELPIPEMKEMDEKTARAFQDVLGADKNRVLVFYCGFTKCTRSHNGAMWARRLGYANVFRCPGGIKAWTEAGYPVQAVKD